jgi:hypothetical protein
MFAEGTFMRFCGLCGKEFEKHEPWTRTEHDTRAHFACAGGVDDHAHEHDVV